MNQNQKTILIDSSNLLHRAVWIAENVKASVNPSYIFLTSVKKYVDKFNTSSIYSIWDKRLVKDKKNYRQTLADCDYKGNRDKERNENVYKHEELTSTLLSSLGVRNMYPGILEGDDVIAWLCKKIPGKKVVVSADHDMFQLINKETIVYSPIKDIIINESNFKEVVGVDHSQFLRYKALMGDKSDNIEGLRKCGPKTATRLVESCPTDNELLLKLGETTLKPFFRNLKLVDLDEGIKQHPGDITIYKEQYSNLKNLQPNFNKFESICKKYNMIRAVQNIQTWKTAFNREILANTLENIVNSLKLK